MSVDRVIQDTYFGTVLVCPICNSERREQKIDLGRSSVWALACECPRAREKGA